MHTRKRHRTSVERAACSLRSAVQHEIAVPVVERLIGRKLLVAQTDDVYEQQYSQQCAANNGPPPQRDPLP